MCSKNKGLTVTAVQGISSAVQHGHKLQSQNKLVKQECMDVGLPHRGRYIISLRACVAQGLRAPEQALRSNAPL